MADAGGKPQISLKDTIETEGLVTVRRGNVGGAEIHRPDDIDDAISSYIQKEYKLAIGTQTAEQLDLEPAVFFVGLFYWGGRFGTLRRTTIIGVGLAMPSLSSASLAVETAGANPPSSPTAVDSPRSCRVFLRWWYTSAPIRRPSEKLSAPTGMIMNS